MNGLPSSRMTIGPCLRNMLGALIAGAWSLNGMAADSMPAIAAPKIPDKSFEITKYGAVGNGTTLNSQAIQKAIDATSAVGGGTVLIPAGKFVSGPIRLASNINLHLAKDAALMMSANFEDFPVKGKDRESFISATDAHDI